MRRQIKNSAIYYCTRAAVTLTGLIPSLFARTAGQWIGTIAYFVARKERQRAREQLAMALDKPLKAKSTKRLTRGVFLGLGHNVVELCRLLRNQNKSPEVTIPSASEKCLTRALKKGKGVIFVTGHVGNWELMAISLARAGFPISTVAKESYDRRFTKMIADFRASVGIRAIIRGRPGASAAMLRALKQNRILGFLIDQDTSVKSAFVPFFQKDAYTPIGPAALAIRTRAPTVVGTIRRCGNTKHIVEIKDCNLTQDPVESTAILTRELENRIRMSPTEWVWFHRRWKTRPSSLTRQ